MVIYGVHISLDATSVSIGKMRDMMNLGEQKVGDWEGELIER